MSRYASQAAAAASSAPQAGAPAFQGNDLFAADPQPPAAASIVVDSRDSMLDKQRALAQEKQRQRMSMSLTVGGGGDMMPGSGLGGPSMGLGAGSMMNGSLLGGGNGGLMMNGGLLSGTSAGSTAAGRSSFASRGAPMMAPGSLTGGLGSAGSFSLSPHNANAGGGLLSGGGLTSPSVASSVTATTSSATSTAAANALPSSAPVSTADSEAAAIAEALKEREKRSAHSSGSDGFGGAAADHSAGGGGGASPGKQLYAPIQPIIIPPSAGTGGMSASAGAGSGGGAVTGLAALDLTDLRRFLTSPVPKNAGIIYCRIERDRSGLTGKWYPSYYLYLQVKETADNNIANTLAAGHSSSSSSGASAAGAGKNLPKGVTSTADIFLLASKKRTANKTSNYLVSMDKRDLNRDSDSFLGKVRSNYFGTEFTIFDDGLAPSDAAAAAAAATKKGLKGGRGSESKMALRQEIASVQYASNVLAARGPRRMKIVIPRILPDGRPVSFQPETDDAEGLADALKANRMKDIYLLTNKQPKWNDQVGAYVLNFNGRVTMASVKNFQLATTEDEDTVVLQFGRIDKEKFTMDIQWPLSPLQAFAITLSSFDYKLACE